MADQSAIVRSLLKDGAPRVARDDPGEMSPPMPGGPKPPVGGPFLAGGDSKALESQAVQALTTLAETNPRIKEVLVHLEDVLGQGQGNPGGDDGAGSQPY